MKRRDFITLMGGASLPDIILPRWANAQVSRARPLVVWLISFAPKKLGGVSFFELFTESMQKYGYINGRNFDLILRSADGSLERLRRLCRRSLSLSLTLSWRRPPWKLWPCGKQPQPFQLSVRRSPMRST